MRGSYWFTSSFSFLGLVRTFSLHGLKHQSEDGDPWLPLIAVPLLEKSEKRGKE